MQQLNSYILILLSMLSGVGLLHLLTVAGFLGAILPS